MRAFPLILITFFIGLASTPAWTQGLECEPCTYDFGKVPVGDSSSYNIQINNTAKTDLTIVSKSEQGSAFSYGKFSVPVVIRPGASVEVPIIFQPTAKGQADGTFNLVATGQNGLLIINVSGSGVSSGNGKLGISPASLNFGNVTVGSSASLQASLTASNDSVTISSDRSNSSEYSILGLDLPLTIPSGQSVPVTIQFTPASSGTAPAKVGFISNAADSPTVEPVTGTGVPSGSGSHNVSLSWNAVETAVGYNVYRGKTKSGPFDQINTAVDSSTSYTDSTVVSGATYYYVTTAVNGQGEQSGYSNVAEAVIPKS